jgi:hypothetical protein
MRDLVERHLPAECRECETWRHVTVFRVFGPRRGDHAGRRTFQSCFYGRAHAGTECLVHCRDNWGLH